MKINLKKYKKYLPSKSFAIAVGLIGGLGLIVLFIFLIWPSKQNYNEAEKKNETALKIGNPTIADLIQKDSDGDGVPDWEETLWGTDPHKKMTFGNMPDATYIENKKKELNIEETGNVNQANLTETEKFAREFFASYSALKSSGQINKDAINNFSSALGQEVSSPDLPDHYTQADVKVDSVDNPAWEQRYYISVGNLFKKYQKSGMLGDELDIVSQSLATGYVNGDTVDPNQYVKLSKIADAYQSFAKEVLQSEVPQSLIDYHLKIANSAYNTGVGVSNMGKIASDPVVGLLGLSQYQKWSEELQKNVTDLENLLLKNQQ